MRLLLGLALFIFVLPVLAQDADVPRFEPVQCSFDVAEDQTVECGFVVVPEDHSHPDNSNTIKLAVVVFRVENALSDPVILLSGGPGEKLAASANYLAGIWHSILPKRDLVIFDQRGAGLSQPALECPEWNKAVLSSLDESESGASYDALMACKKRLVTDGINLSAYNTVQNAADVNDIRLALGYDQVNLFGVSYGSILAQSVMRDFPDIVRSVVIDSVVPLDTSIIINSLSTAIAALDHLLETCTADAACNAAYPNLRQVFFDLLERLNADPVPITLTNPLTGAAVPSQLNGSRVLQNMMAFLYQAAILPLLPQTIFDVAAGDYMLMTRLSSMNLTSYQTITRGMHYSIYCSADLIGRTPEDYLNVITALPKEYRITTDPEEVLDYGPFNLCAGWGVDQSDPSVKMPVVSDIPTLLLGGEFDPVTPFSYAERVAEHLSNSYAYEFPAVGHSVNVSSECARNITGIFIDNPAQEPDTACLGALTEVAFVLPGAELAPVTLVAYENAAMGFSSVQPKGWKEVQPGVFTRATSTIDGALISQQAGFNTTLDQMMTIVQTQLGLDAPPEPASTYAANGLTWRLYELAYQGNALDVAFAEEDGVLYVIQMVSGSSDERDFLLANVFLPTVDAFTPAR